jgi:hypothetical protein
MIMAMPSAAALSHVWYLSSESGERVGIAPQGLQGDQVIQMQLLEKRSSRYYNQPVNKQAKRLLKKGRMPAGANNTCLEGMTSEVDLPIYEEVKMEEMTVDLSRAGMHGQISFLKSNR